MDGINIDLNTTLHKAIEMIPEDGQDILMTFFHQGLLKPHHTLKEALMSMDNASDYHYELFDKIMEMLVRKKEKPLVTNKLGSKFDAMPYEDGISVFIKKFGDEPVRSIGNLMSMLSGFIPQVEPVGAPSELGITCGQLHDCGDSLEQSIFGNAMDRLFVVPERDASVMIMKLKTLIAPKVGMGTGEDISSTPFELDDNSNKPQAIGSMNQQQLRDANTKGFAKEALEITNKLIDKLKNPVGVKFVDFLENLKDNQSDNLIDLIKQGYSTIHSD